MPDSKMIKSENASDTWKRNINSTSAQPVARLTQFEWRGHKKFPKGPPFAYVFWKFFIKVRGGGSIGFSPPRFDGGGGHCPLAPPRQMRHCVLRTESKTFPWNKM